MAKAKKIKKERPDKYDEKLSINGTFEELVKVSLDYTPKDKIPPAKKAAKKKK